MRDPAMHSCPELLKMPAATVATHLGMSASANTNTADLPPSSNEVRFSCGATRAAMSRAVAGEPVNDTPMTSGCSTNGAPASFPNPSTVL